VKPIMAASWNAAVRLGPISLSPRFDWTLALALAQRAFVASGFRVLPLSRT